MTTPLMRSKLFVPGARLELFGKALSSAADALSFDLEDSVPSSGKATARNAVAAWFKSMEAAQSDKVLIVRVNARDSAHFAADIDACALPRVNFINMPKCESSADVHAAVAALEEAELRNQVTVPISLLINIETAKAMRNALAIATAHPRVTGLQLGLGDLFEPLHIDRDDAANIHAAMFALRLAGGEAGVFCYDAAFANLDDPGWFRAEAEMARRLGFIGKSCIHPKQVLLANEVFSPSAEEIAAARRVVAAATHAHAQGHGAFVVDGRMIDPPFLRRAQGLVLLADKISGT